MKILYCAAAAFMFAACSKGGEASAGAAAAPAVEAADQPYAPMAVFAPFSGKAFRGEWTDENGAKIVDIASYELILGGRALQSTHRLEGGDYGGRTIFFYDEGAKTYVFHYFTTAGFHTSGAAQMVDGGLVTEEKVEGHDTIASVRSTVTFGADAIEIDAVYISKDGTETPGGHRVYREIANPGRLFPDTQ